MGMTEKYLAGKEASNLISRAASLIKKTNRNAWAGWVMYLIENLFDQSEESAHDLRGIQQMIEYRLQDPTLLRPVEPKPHWANDGGRDA